MSRNPDSGRLNLAEVFRRVQHRMLSELAVNRLLEHASASGAASEQSWLDLFNQYLPGRYRSAPAFIIDCDGRRSRQIDLAVFDNLSTPPLFPHPSGLHVPAESVYAVFEIKPAFSKQWLRDAGIKAASVRTLRRTSLSRPPVPPQPILAGLLATTSVWNPATFETNLQNALATHRPTTRLDLGCSLQHGSFEVPSNSRSRPTISTPDESLIFFMLHLLARLRSMGTPAADIMQYAKSLRSFRS
jgi:hypothetical protein